MTPKGIIFCFTTVLLNVRVKQGRQRWDCACPEELSQSLVLSVHVFQIESRPRLRVQWMAGRNFFVTLPIQV